MEGPAGYTYLYHDKKYQRIFLTNEIGMVDIYLIQSFPPILVNSVQTSTEYSLYGFEINLIKGYIFSCASNGLITVLDLNTVGKEKLIKEVSYFGGESPLTVVRYRKEENEVITGDQNGRIAVWSLKKGESIYSWKGHDSSITQIYYYPNEKVIITAGKDKFIKTWKLPEKWINDDIKKFEENEIQNMSDTMAMLKLQKSLERPEDYNSDEDSLNGWDYKADLD